MSQRILIIDDEAEIRRNLTFGLTQEGFVCTACPDGISAIHELQDARDKGIGYNYLISDIFMPDIDGMKILKVIKHEYPDLPVLIITGFGNEELEFTALEEHNTGFLDKPFEISTLVEALKKLEPGVTTLEEPKVEIGTGARETMSSYLSLRIADPAQSMDVYNALYNMPGMMSCDAVRGDVDIICVLHAGSEQEMTDLQAQVAAVDGVEVVSTSQVDRPKLDRDLNEFINVYRDAVKVASIQKLNKPAAVKSYVTVDIDPNFVQQVFATLFFIDEVLVCDMVDDGSKLIGVISEMGAFGKTPRIIEKLSNIDGVLRIKQASIINMREM
jgi:CheY-like chemotaxis protein/nitrate reductase NapAB chaperone NapD